MNRAAKELLTTLPTGLRQLLQAGHFVPDSVGCSSAAVYRINGLPQVGVAYLKIMESVSGDDLLREKQILDWLQGRLPVPRVLYFEQVGQLQYLLLSAIPGRSAESEVYLSGSAAQGMVRALARGLRQIHALGISDCPFPRHLHITLAEAQQRVEQGLVDTADFNPENSERSPADILQELQNRRPRNDDLVFTHGDYCLPNIILQGDSLSGFIDWGRGGVADRYVDLALAVRSLKYNLGEASSPALTQLFWQEYGLVEQIDARKIDYYILLDELF